MKTESISNMSPFKWLISSLVISAVFLSVSCTDNDIFDPKVYMDRQIPEPRVEAAGHRFSILSPDENYELAGEVYESNQIEENQGLYDLSNYQKSSSCNYYKSNIEMEALQAEEIEFLSEEGLVSHDSNRIYVIGAEEEEYSEKTKFLTIYSFNRTQILPPERVSLKDRTKMDLSVESNVFMAQMGETILLSDGQVMYGLRDRPIELLNQKYEFDQINGLKTSQNSQGDEFLGLSIVTYANTQAILMLYSNKVTLLSFDAGSRKVETILQIKGTDVDAQSTDPVIFEDVEVNQNSELLILSVNKLYIYAYQSTQPIVEKLDGDFCTRIYTHGSTVHILCEYEKRTFFAEYYFHPGEHYLKLNRYYNDLQNYRMVSYLKNYMLMVGENEIILKSTAVNRKILLEMENPPFSERFVSFGLQKLEVLPEYQESPYNQTLIAIGQSFIVLFKLKHVPSEVWCYIDTAPESFKTSIMVVRNVSKCEVNAHRHDLDSICMNLKPVQIEFEQYEIEKKITIIGVVVIVLMVFVVTFLCLGCVFRENMNYNLVSRKIREKVRKLKSKTKELKEI